MRQWVLTIILCLAPVWAVAQDISVLQEPDTVLLMRHALAPGTGDPATFALRDCATQRNLDATGRRQALRIADSLRAADLGPLEVWSSQWCRCLETARLLALGPVTEIPALNSFFRNRDRAAAQSAATLAQIAQLPTGTRAILVTHQVNITALTGIVPRSGEIIVARPVQGGLEVTGRFLIDP